ncbi:MAG: hypothetical protein JO233_05525 [Candidatus Eremiobacteraeota bacterium]|nr:hypothetical protein [Candidatus Eremiobacteraeota bacterium]
MTVTWAVVILIVAVLIWLAITAVWLTMRVNRLRRRVEGLKETPVMTALTNAAPDIERLNRAVVELQAQAAVLKSAQAKLTASLAELNGLSVSADLDFVRRAYRGLVELLS